MLRREQDAFATHHRRLMRAQGRRNTEWGLNAPSGAAARRRYNRPPGVRWARRPKGKCGGAPAALANSHLTGRYDLAHLQAFHRFVFGDVYPWAGQVRTISKAESMFCLPQYIDGYAADIATPLARQDHLTGLDRPAFLDGLAELWADLNALHPFREGNGRATRALLSQLARDAGHPIACA